MASIERLKQGVLYFNLGDKCALRLFVSLSSLRKHYRGAVAILNAGKPEQWFIDECGRLGACVIEIPNTGEKALVQKAGTWKYSPFETTLFLDADTLVLKPIDSIFDMIAMHGYAVNHFSGWTTTGRKIAKRINAWEPAIGADGVKRALDYGSAINTGIHGYVMNHPILPRWQELTRRGASHGCTVRLVDELAIQCLLPDYPDAGLMPEAWGASVRFGDVSKATIMHYHGQKHTLDLPACEPWKNQYLEWAVTTPLSKTKIKQLSDRRLDRWLNQVQKKHELTIVTAVNPAYMSKFKANFKLWMQTPGIREQQFLVFWNRQKPDFLTNCGNVKLVRWKWDIAGDNIRERMLSAFVFGVAEHVRTEWWMKLDADATPTGVSWEWPDFKNGGFDIIGHRCNYTKTKGQPGADKHFLNQLDEWWQKKTGGKPIFPANIQGSTYVHNRAASYCWLERTANTRYIAELCGNRLPIPSHDTVACYVAERKGWKIERRNMKRFFKP